MPEVTESPSSNWTFLTNHAFVLLTIDDAPDSLVREIAVQVGITERAAHSILRDLEREGYVIKSRVGRRNQYRINSDARLKHPMLHRETISRILELPWSE